MVMEHPHPVDPRAAERIPERDVAAMLVMLDYLITEIGRIDVTSAQCLMLARKSLTEAVADAFVKAH
jgi:predicted trehalose synthase